MGVLSLAVPARAAFTTYSSQSSFLAAAGTVSTENFDEFISPTNFPNTATIDGVTYFSQGLTAVATTGGYPDFLPPSSPPNILLPTNVNAPSASTLLLTALAFPSSSAHPLDGGSVQSLGFTFIIPFPAFFTLSIYESLSHNGR
jgi:hypothetical protein